MKRIALIIGLLLLVMTPRAVANTTVMIELALLVDVSNSIDENEYALQRRGYEMAFRSEAVQRQVVRQGPVAVAYIEWGDIDDQRIRIPWTVLTTEEDCWQYANEIAALERGVIGTSTYIAAALDFAATQLDENEYTSFKRVIDVSGDGMCHNWYYYNYTGHTELAPQHGVPWNTVRARLSGRVDQVNGICITTTENTVNFYSEVLPLNGFAMQANNFVEFQDRIREKITRELNPPDGFYD